MNGAGRSKGRFVKKGEQKRRELSSMRMKSLHSSNVDRKTQSDSSLSEPAQTATSTSETSNSGEDRSTDRTPLRERVVDGQFQNASNSGDNQWREGRRIVELGIIADQMKGCVDCGQRLHLDNITNETRYGLGSILYIMCSCGVINSVETNKTHRNGSKRGRPVFDVNTKAALGICHAGLGHRNATSFLSTLEICGMHHSSLKTRETEIRGHLETVASQSCDAALQEEVSTTEQDNPDVSDQEPRKPECCLKYDMGWQKRGSGRAYDSKSGVGTAIGNKTGKICAYDVRISDCRTCQLNRNKGKDPPAHDCFKNWSGSSKGMEPDVGGSIFKKVEEKGVLVSTIIMDDDATTMARLRKFADHDIEKWSDSNHTQRHLSNGLYILQKKHKVLNTDVINYYKRGFTYALNQNKGDEDGFRAAVLNVVPHSFGEHQNCGDWCGYVQSPDTYRHTGISRDMQGEVLKEDLTAVFTTFANNAKKIAPGGSTKEVESFNNMVASKAPKRCHFSASGSLNSRVNCAVAQKILGNSYISDINISVGLSPGKIAKEQAEKRDSERKRQNTYYNRIDVKRRKLQLKSKKNKSRSSAELREGITYQTAVATTSTAVTDTEYIPAPVCLPDKKLIGEGEYNHVFCDIETSSLQRDADILQISAVCGDDKFDQYIAPTKNVSPAAAAVTGLTVQHIQQNIMINCVESGTQINGNQRSCFLMLHCRQQVIH